MGRTRLDKLQDHLSYPPRAMRADRAAAYLGGMSTATFLRLVKDGKFPKGIKIKGMVMWDRLELDAAFENFKDDDEARERNLIDEHFGVTSK